MALCVKGIRRTAGEYEGKPFDNTYLHCIAPPDKNTLCGELVEIVKVNSTTFTHLCDGLGVGFGELVGAQVRIFYDKYGRVDDFEIIG